MTSSPDLSRVAVVGTSGSGKTTFARDLAAILCTSHIELDALHWLENWQERDVDSFRELVATEVAGERWVIDGNYSRVREQVWSRATTVAWLNYSFPRTLARMTTRTFRRALRGEELWSGNREDLAKFFFSRDSLLLWLLKSFWRNRRVYGEIFAGEGFPGLERIEFRRPQEAERWLSQLADSGA